MSDYGFNSPTKGAAMSGDLADVPSIVSETDRRFPILAQEQIRRIRGRGRRRAVKVDDVLYEPGDPNPKFYVVLSGELENVRHWAGTETRVAVIGPGRFTGEVNLLSGRPAILRLAVSET